MKFFGILVFLFLVAAPAEGLELRKGRWSSSLVQKKDAGSKFAPTTEGWTHTLEECMVAAKEFLKDGKRANDGGQITSLHAIEKAQDYCALTYKPEDNNYVCTHFRKFLDHAFHLFPEDQTVTVRQFCKETENHALSMQQQVTKLEDVGNGNILNFKVSEKCPPAIAEAIHPKKALPKEEVADFWYAFCVSQDCAHFLPSRTRWCNINLPHPRHSIEVCQMAREYAKVDMASYPEKEVPPADICSIYMGYVEEVRLTLEAYEHVMYGDTREKIPVPKDPVRALTSSRLVNQAAKNHIRDHSAHKVIPFTETKEAPYYHSGTTRPVPMLFATSILAAFLGASSSGLV